MPLRLRIATALLIGSAFGALAQPDLTPSAGGPPAAVSKPPASAPAHGQLLEQFAHDVMARVREHVQRGVAYPPEALANHWEGIVRIAVVYGWDGEIKDIAVRHSSGHPVLDQAALDIVRGMALPQAPEALRGTEFDITFPISFRLQIDRPH
jgi:protein TonB